MALADILMGGASTSSAALPVPQTSFNLADIAAPRVSQAPARQPKSERIRNTVGTILDLVAGAGGRTGNGYWAAKERLGKENEVRQAAETARMQAEAKRMQQDNAFATIRANPQDQGGYIDLAASGYEKAPDFYKSLNPQDQSMVNQPETQRLVGLLEQYPEGSKERELVLMRLGQLGGVNTKPVYRSTPGGGTAVIGQDGSVQQIIPGQWRPTAARGSSGGGGSRGSSGGVAGATRGLGAGIAAAEDPNASGITPTERTRRAGLPQTRQNFSAGLQSLAQAYLTLQARGEAPGAAKSTGGNISNYLQATGVGQLVGRAQGTERQAILDSIGSSGSYLFPLYANVSGLTSKQMDTPAEQERFLAALGTPTASVRANIIALDRLAQRTGVPNAVRDILTPEQRAEFFGGKSAPQKSAAPSGWKIRKLP